MNARTGIVGETSVQIFVLEKWGPRFVVCGDDGKEEILWGKDLRRCSDNPHPITDPYEAFDHNKWNRKRLVGVGRGTLVSCRVNTSVVAPVGCAVNSHPAGGEWKKVKVLRVIRSGCSQTVEYNVPRDRCIHDSSVKVSKRMLTRARRDNKLWGDGGRPPATLTERHVVSAQTYDHLREWVFSTDFLEPLKATEQATKRGHCFAIREAISSTYERYKVAFVCTSLCFLCAHIFLLYHVFK